MSQSPIRFNLGDPMKFHIAINLERMDAQTDMVAVRDHVIDMVQMAAGRICRPRWKARTIVEATAGSFERWGLELGDVVEVAVDE